jgi:hypothetical protein
MRKKNGKMEFYSYADADAEVLTNGRMPAGRNSAEMILHTKYFCQIYSKFFFFEELA